MVKGMIIIGSTMVALFIYSIIKNFLRSDREYQKIYATIITSDKYKVKGQYEE